MPETWTVSTGGRTYGPYTITQMQTFAIEGRLAPHSLVARSGETSFHIAGEDSNLAALFRAGTPTGTVADLARAEERSIQRFGRRDEEGEAGEPAHYLIVADMKSRSAAGVEEEIFNLGPAYTVMPQVWLLTSDASINVVRNTLVQRLGKLDMLFVVDASRDKAAWFNFGPEADTRIRRLWARARKSATANAAS